MIMIEENRQTERNEMRQKKENKNKITGISVAPNQFYQIVANVHRAQRAVEPWADGKIMATITSTATENKEPFGGSTELILNFWSYFCVGFFLPKKIDLLIEADKIALPHRIVFFLFSFHSCLSHFFLSISRVLSISIWFSFLQLELDRFFFRFRFDECCFHIKLVANDGKYGFPLDSYWRVNFWLTLDAIISYTSTSISMAMFAEARFPFLFFFFSFSSRRMKWKKCRQCKRIQ